jgi:hypothetical protein
MKTLGQKIKGAGYTIPAPFSWSFFYKFFMIPENADAVNQLNLSSDL